MKHPKRAIKWYRYAWVYYEPRLQRYVRTSWYGSRAWIQASNSIDKVACLVRWHHKHYTLRKLYAKCGRRGLPTMNFAMMMYNNRSAPIVVWICGDVSREECLWLATKT